MWRINTILAPFYCGSPDKQTNTTIIGSEYNIGSTINYECPEGHMLVGNKTRTCMENGFWSNTAPTCKCMSYFNQLKTTLYYYYYY